MLNSEKILTFRQEAQSNSILHVNSSFFLFSKYALFPWLVYPCGEGQQLGLRWSELHKLWPGSVMAAITMPLLINGSEF